MNIKAVPLTYKGITFRSTLEADWARTFDTLGIYWNYEPVALQLPSGQLYRPDFYFPTMRTWAEVKGPHWERIDKAVELDATLNVVGIGWWDPIHVIVLEAGGPGDAACWRGPGDDRVIRLVECGEAQNRFTWYDSKCWLCADENLGGLHCFYRSASDMGEHDILLPTRKMARAPRPEMADSKGAK